MDFEESVFVEDKDELINQSEEKFNENLKVIYPETSNQLITLSKYLKNNPNRYTYIKMFSQLKNISGMNMYMLYIAIRYREIFADLKPNKNNPTSSLDVFLTEKDEYEDMDWYQKILINSKVDYGDKKNTPEFRFDSKIGLASYLKLLDNFLK